MLPNHVIFPMFLRHIFHASEQNSIDTLYIYIYAIAMGIYIVYNI